MQGSIHSLPWLWGAHFFRKALQAIKQIARQEVSYSMWLRPGDSIALQFKGRDDFRKALEILWELRKTAPEVIPFVLPPAENTFIVSKKYLPNFKDLEPVPQEVGSVADLPQEEQVTRLREKYFWPRPEEGSR